MSRVQDIIDNARGSLADPNKERWTDARLLSLLSKGQIHFAQESRLLVGKAAINIQLNNPDYSLPTDAYLLIRAVGPDGRIPLISSYDLDAKNKDWQIATGTKIEYVVYDIQSPNKFRLYPIITEQPQAAPYTFNSVFGVVTEFDTLECVVVGDVYGVVSDTDVFVSLQYVKVPEKLVDFDSELTVPRIYDDTLEHYVVGHAFRDDLDTGHQQLGASHIQLYAAGVVLAKNAHAVDNVEGEKTYSVHRKVF